MAGSEKAGNDKSQIPGGGPISLDEKERLSGRFKAIWDDPDAEDEAAAGVFGDSATSAEPAVAAPSAEPAPAPAPEAKAPDPGPAPAAAPVPSVHAPANASAPPKPAHRVGSKTMIGVAPQANAPKGIAAPPPSSGAPPAVVVRSPSSTPEIAAAPAVAAPTPAPAVATVSPAPVPVEIAPPPSPPPVEDAPLIDVESVEPEPAAAAAFNLPPPAPVPTFADAAPAEHILPDSKAEYAPPRALPAAHNKTTPGLAPVSVAPEPEAPVPSSALTTPVAIPSRRPPFVAPIAPSAALDGEPDETRTRDTIPPRSRTARKRSLGVLVGVGTVIGAVVVVALLRATSSEDAGNAASRTNSVVTEPKARPSAPLAAPPAPEKQQAAEPVPTSTVALEETPSAEEHKEPARATAGAHAPQHPAKAKAIAAKAEAPTAPVTRPSPKVRQEGARSDKPRAPSRPASPPSQAGGGIVRESPF